MNRFNVVWMQICALKPLFENFGGPLGNQHCSDVSVGPDHVGHPGFNIFSNQQKGIPQG